MQMQGMNQFANRGFGGTPQPQRQPQGNRRGNRGGPGGFRGNSRFDNNQRNQNQGSQRPADEPNKFQPQGKPAAQANIPSLTNLPAQAKPQTPQQQTPNQPTPAKPAQPQQQKQAQTPAATPQQQAKPDAANQQVKTAQTTPNKTETSATDKTAVEPKVPNQTPINQPNNQNQQKNVNGTFGGNKGGWQPVGAQGNKGNFNQGGQGSFQGGQGIFGQGPGNFQANKPGGQGNFGQDKQAGQGTFGQDKQGGQANFGQDKPTIPASFGQDKQGGQGVYGNDKQGRQGSFGQDKQGGPGNFGQDKQGGQGNFGQDKQPFGQGNFQGNRYGGQGNFQGNRQGGGNFQGNKQFGQKGSGGPGGHADAGGQGRPGGQMRGGYMGNKRGPQDGPQREEHMLANKLKDLIGPLLDLPPLEQPEVKFNGRGRLYIGNLTNDVTEEEITNMFKAFGECAELFLNKEKNFGFIKMDYRVNAERAKRELDGKQRNGKTLRVRFAPHNSAIRVKNLPPFVSNELLYRAFEIFGKIERAYVKVDDRGKPLGEGVVEYARKPSALAAIRNCTEKCFFLTSSLRPVIVESFDEPDELDGYPEKNMPRKHPEFMKAREYGPRFSEPSSFEHEYGTRWKQLHELHKQKEEALKKELAAEEEKLEAQMEYAKYEHETELLREQLRQREQDRERQKRSWEMAERAAEERREAERLARQRQEEELEQRMRHQDDELRRRQQENTLFVQAQRLNNMLDRQDQAMFDKQQPMDGGYRDQYSGYDDQQQGRGWEGPRQVDDYPNKRRRY